MAKKFFPMIETKVKAQTKGKNTHPKGTEYRLAIGRENWGNGKFVLISKVQMVYNNKVAGRRSPSYPEGTDDYERVTTAMKELRKTFKENKEDFNV